MFGRTTKETARLTIRFTVRKKNDVSSPEGVIIGPTSTSASQPPSSDKPIADSAPLKIETLKTGDGAEATNGKSVSINYTCNLTDGTNFMSNLSYDPMKVILGAGQTTKGWEKSITGMKVNGRRRLTISPTLAYTDFGMDINSVPTNQALICEIELLKVD